MKNLVLGAAALVMTAAPLAASAQPYGHDWHGGGNGGAAVAAGLFGLAVGAAIADSSYHRDYAYQPTYAYDGGYVQHCFWQTRLVRGPWGRVHYQQVEVCR